MYAAPTVDDGRRVLVTRYWPRGVKRERIDEYVPALSPSRELLRAFRDGDIDWAVFRERYLIEMEAPEAMAARERLREEAADSTVTVLCVCADAERCHRSVLAQLLG